MQTNTLTRRGFLGTTAVAGFAGAGLAAGVSSAEAAPANSYADHVLASGYSCDGGETSAEPISPVDPPAQWDEEADIVVVGAGAGGLNACLRASELGASVICIEKCSQQGGSSQHASEWTCIAGGSRIQNELGYATPTFPFDPDAATDFFMSRLLDARRELIYQLVVKGPECIDWMEDLGMEWETDPYAGPSCIIAKGAVDDGWYPLKAKLITDWVYEQAVARGATFEFETVCEALVYDGERVAGVKVDNIYGTGEKYIKANKAVFLAAGGFCCNRSMLKEWAPIAYRSCVSSFALPSDTGECTRMCLGLNADMDGLGSFLSYSGGIPEYDLGTGPWQHNLITGDARFSFRFPWLQINGVGERVGIPASSTDGAQFSESIALPEKYQDQVSTLHVLPDMIVNQPGMRAYQIFDSHYEEYYDEMAAKGLGWCYDTDTPGIDYVPEFYFPHDWRVSVRGAIERGSIMSADTLEELAEKLGLKPEVVVGAVGDWNAICEAGVDDVLGYSADALYPVLDPPYYGIIEGGQIMVTNAGVRVTPDMEVLDVRGETIPGLYAGFHTAGGYIGRDQWLEGPVQGALGASFLSGYIASSAIMGKE